MKRLFWRFRLWLSKLIEPKRFWTIGYIVENIGNGRVLVLDVERQTPTDELYVPCDFKATCRADLIVTTDGRIIKSRWGGV